MLTRDLFGVLLLYPLLVTGLAPYSPAAAASDRDRPGLSTDWYQAGGPDGSWTLDGVPKPPIHWSVTRNENIVWKTTLPEEGQGGVTVSRDRLFVETMKPLDATAKRKEGHDTVGYCLDSKNGKILWSVDLPGSVDSTYAYGFSDSTTPTQ